MSSLRFFIVSLALIQISLCASSPRNASMVIQILRHGVRVPASNEASIADPWWNMAEQNELTSTGLRQQYILGKLMAQRYPQLFETYDPAKMYVRASNFNRTMQSAQAQLRGIFDYRGATVSPNASFSFVNPPWANADLISEIDQQFENLTAAVPENVTIVPIFTRSLSEDAMLYPGPNSCPASGAWFGNRSVDQNSQKVFALFNETAKKIQPYGYNFTNLGEWQMFGDVVQANYMQGKPLPAGIVHNSQEYNDTAFAYNWFVTYVIAGTGLQQQIFNIPMVDFLLSNINSKAAGTNDNNFILLSAHDTTIIGILGPLNITSPDCLLTNYFDVAAGRNLSFPNCIYPEYSAQLMFEYYDAVNGSEPFIKMVYNAKTIDICGHGTGECTLSEFNALWKRAMNVTIEDFPKICGVPSKTPVLNKQSSKGHSMSLLENLLLAVSVVMVVALLGAISYLVTKSKKNLLGDYLNLNDTKVNLGSENGIAVSFK